MLDHRTSDVILSEQRPRLQEKKKRIKFRNHYLALSRTSRSWYTAWHLLGVISFPIDPVWRRRPGARRRRPAARTLLKCFRIKISHIFNTFRKISVEHTVISVRFDLPQKRGKKCQEKDREEVLFRLFRRVVHFCCSLWWWWWWWERWMDVFCWNRESEVFYLHLVLNNLCKCSYLLVLLVLKVSSSFANEDV